MYICPTCKREFVTEDMIVKHSLACWRECHPNHKSKDAPRSEDINIRQINNETLAFFESFVKE